MGWPIHAAGSRWLIVVGGLALALAGGMSFAEPAKAPTLTAAQQQQLQERDRLWAQVKTLLTQGKLAEGSAVLAKILVIERHVFGPGHREVAATLGFLVGLNLEREDFASARTAQQEVLAIRTRQHPPSHWRMTDARLRLSHIDRLARMSPGERRQLAEAYQLNRKAIGLHQQGKTREAVALLEKSLALRKRLGEDHPDYATGLHNLAVLYRSLGDYARAEPLYQQALAIDKKVLGENHPGTAISLNNLANLYSSLGDYVKAEALLQRALAVNKQALGEKDSHYAVTLNDLANLHASVGDYARAEPLYAQALAITRQMRGVKHPDYATNLHNLGLLYQDMGAYAQAEPLLRRACAIRKEAVGEKHPDHATSLNTLGVLCWLKGDEASAEPLLRQALAIRKQVLGENHPACAASLNNLANLVAARGDYTQARVLVKKSLAILKQAVGESHPHYATGLGNLALLSWLLEDPLKAEALLKQSLASTRRNLQLAAAGQSERQQLAMTLSLRRNLDSYLSLVLHARLPAESAYGQVLAWKGAVFVRQQNRRALRRTLQEDRQAEVAGLLDDLQSTTRRLASLAFAVPQPSQRAAWQRRLEELSDRIEKGEKELARRSAAFRRQQQRQRLTPAQLQAALPRDAALIDFLEYTHSSPPPQRKGKMRHQRHLVAFVVRAGGPVRQVHLGPIKPISEASAKWRLTLKRTRPVQGSQDPAVALRRLVWQPLEEHLKGVRVALVAPDGVLNELPLAALPGKTPNTYLIEELALAGVPVPQLLPELLAKPPRKEQAAKKTQQPSLLLVGDVNFDALPRTAAGGAGRSAPRGSGKVLPSFVALQGTRVEILAVRDAFEERFPDGRVKMLRKDQATEAMLRQQAPRHRFLHLATHGFFAPPELRSALAPSARGAGGQPLAAEPDQFGRHGVIGFHPGLLSGLVLAGANRPVDPEQDDGILTALEVAELDLGGVELAVLSACETGLGTAAGGEGLLGLQRAFQVAGARSVVASLWMVDDRATRALMTRFYQNLWSKKLSKLEALREAQLWMLREGAQRGLIQRGLALREARNARAKGRTPRTPPLYWAAFQLSGDWR